MKKTIVVCALLFLSGCFMGKGTRHRALDPDLIATFEPGKSTARDVVVALGAPTEVIQLGRRSAYRYDHGVNKQAGLFLILVGLYGVDSQEDRVWFFFDEEDVLTHAGATLEAASAEFSVPPF